MFDLASGYKERGMAAYSELQQREFAREKDGYTCELVGRCNSVCGWVGVRVCGRLAGCGLWFGVG